MQRQATTWLRRWKRPGQDFNASKGLKATSASENDGLSPPSAARCRCPHPKRGDGFAFCVALCGKWWCGVQYAAARLRQPATARPLPG